MRPVDLAVQVAAALCRRFEGCYLRPYLCPAGVPTIGYGATYYDDGRRVTLADAPIPRARAEALLLWMVRTRYLPAELRKWDKAGGRRLRGLTRRREAEVTVWEMSDAG